MAYEDQHGNSHNSRNERDMANNEINSDNYSFTAKVMAIILPIFFTIIIGFLAVFLFLDAIVTICGDMLPMYFIVLVAGFFFGGFAITVGTTLGAATTYAIFNFVGGVNAPNRVAITIVGIIASIIGVFICISIEDKVSTKIRKTKKKSTASKIILTIVTIFAAILSYKNLQAGFSYMHNSHLESTAQIVAAIMTIIFYGGYIWGLYVGIFDSGHEISSEEKSTDNIVTENKDSLQNDFDTSKSQTEQTVDISAKKKNVLAIISLVAGIVSVVSMGIFIFPQGVAFCSGVIGLLVKKGRKGMCIAGILLSITATVIVLAINM